MKRVRRRRIHPAHQRGAALLTAMIIVTLVSTLAAAMVWQQWRAVQVEAAERSRVQSAWILSGALDWASLILREDAKSGGADHLGEPWAVPLAEARLSTFLAVDKDNAEDAPEAFLSGSITDAQSRYNLRNLVDNNHAVVPLERDGLRALLQAIRLPPNLADTLANGLRDALTPADPANRSATTPLMPASMDELTWLGLDEDTVEQLRPYVTLLPVQTPVNANTAPKEVLAAVTGLDPATAEHLVQTRQRTPFKTLSEVHDQVPGITLSAQRIDVSSRFFEVRGRLRLEDHVLEESSLVERRGLNIVSLSRRRQSSQEPAR
jgi:general secretion pathway protein K